MMYPLLRAIMRGLAATILAGRLHVEGLENVPREGGVLVVGNHVGAVDPPLTGALIPRLDVHYMAKAEAFVRWYRWLYYGYNAFPVVRDSADRTALRHTLDLLGSGHVVLVYPEGSRSPDGRMREPQPGVGFLARHSGATIVPVAVWGTEKVVPKGVKRIHRSDVHISFGAPMTLPSEPAGRAGNRAAATAIMSAIAAMLPPAYRPAGPQTTAPAA